MTLADLLKEHGYRTAMVGKWHLGWNWKISPAQKPLFSAPPRKPAEVTDLHLAAWRETYGRPIGGGPLACGFDEYFGVDVPNWSPSSFIEGDRITVIPDTFLPVRMAGRRCPRLGLRPVGAADRPDGHHRGSARRETTGQRLRGRSEPVPLLRGGIKPVRRHAISTSVAGVPALRDGPWKIIFSKGNKNDPFPGQLYNLAEDPGETNNLWDREPERVAQLTETVERLVKQGRLVPGATQSNDVEILWNQFLGKTDPHIVRAKYALRQ